MMRKHAPPSTLKLSNDERMDIFANMIVDRVLEEEQLYIETLKKDPNSKKGF